jgi:hypothetical protein
MHIAMEMRTNKPGRNSDNLLTMEIVYAGVLGMAPSEGAPLEELEPLRRSHNLGHLQNGSGSSSSIFD